MNDHECGPDGLGGCIYHPRWNVTKSPIPGRRRWWAWKPSSGGFGDEPFPTFNAAVAYATAQARAEKVAAIQDGAA